MFRLLRFLPICFQNKSEQIPFCRPLLQIPELSGSEVPKRGRSKRRRTQKDAKARERAQMTANASTQRSAKAGKSTQNSAKERFCVKLRNRPNTVSESTVSNTELSEFSGPHRVLGRKLSEFLFNLLFGCQSPLTEFFAELSESSLPKLSKKQSSSLFVGLIF